MNVSLTPELEQYVNGKVQSGLYHSASEVIREGLRLLREKDEVHQKKLQALRRDIQVGIDQAERDQHSRFNEQTLEEIRTEGRKRLAAERKSKSRN
jgi:antitoxin ParD1/3/4